MVILNTLTVLISNVISRLSVWKDEPPAPAMTLGYGYGITDDQE